MFNFTKEQIYIVTGASSGIGASASAMINSYGASVVAIGRNRDKLLDIQKTCKYPENFYIEEKDLTEDIEGLPKYITNLKEKYGKFSGLVCCAGIFDICPTKAITYQDTKNLFDINYFVPVLLTKGIVDKRNNTGENVSIVAIASVEAELLDKGLLGYCGTKNALIASFKCIAKEYSEKNIRINTISPGYTKTPLLDKVLQNKLIDKNAEQLIEPEEISNFIVFLLSNRGKAFTGNDYKISGGQFIV